jgi:ATP-binding cassette subfamily F protein 3
VGPFDGDLDDYQRYLLDEARRLREAARLEAAAAAPAATPAPAAAKPQEQRRTDAAARQQLAARTRPLKKELAQAEQRMARLQADRAALEQRLAGPLPAAEIAEAGRQLKALTQDLETAEERWLALTSEIEALEASA